MKIKKGIIFLNAMTIIFISIIFLQITMFLMNFENMLSYKEGILDILNNSADIIFRAKEWEFINYFAVFIIGLALLSSITKAIFYLKADKNEKSINYTIDIILSLVTAGFLFTYAYIHMGNIYNLLVITEALNISISEILGGGLLVKLYSIITGLLINAIVYNILPLILNLVRIVKNK